MSNHSYGKHVKETFLKEVDDVKETEAPSEQEHDVVPVFCHSDFAACVSKEVCEVLSDQIQIITAINSRCINIDFPSRPQVTYLLTVFKPILNDFSDVVALKTI